MPAAGCNHMATDRHAQQRQVPDEIGDLMTHRLVLEAQLLAFEQPVFTSHQFSINIEQLL